MQVLLTFCILFWIALIPCLILFKKYRNPYKLIMVFGKKGSGKTTLIAKLAYKFIRQGKPVYSTVFVPGAHLIDPSCIGFTSFPRDSVIFIDEVGMIWDNRNFKNFKPEVRDYFKLQRHYGHTVYLFSQTFDIDKKLRDLTDTMYLVRCYMGWFSVAKQIYRNVVLTEPDGESESRIADSLEFAPLWLCIFGAKTRIFTYIPHWTNLFDSFEAPKLGNTVAKYIPIPDNLKKFYHVKGDKLDKRRMVQNRLREWNNRIGRKRKNLVQRCLSGLVCVKAKIKQTIHHGQDRSDV